MKKQTFPRADVLPFLTQRLLENNLPKNIVISGATCSGKTTLAGEVQAILQMKGSSTVILPLDSYYRDVDDPMFPKNARGEPIFDVPQSFDRGAFIAAAKDLSAGSSIELPCYDLPTNKRIFDKTFKVLPAMFILYEGLFATSCLKDLPGTLHVFMQTPTKTCMERRIVRDKLVWGVSAEQAEEHFIKRVLPYWDYCLNQQEFAHVIVDSN